MEYATLQNGLKMPMEGFGVFQVRDKEECKRSVLDAIRTGYRLIDTAAYYENEKEVGEGIKDSGIPRDDLFITTKLWNDMQRESRQRESFEKSLDNLGVDAVDLYLIHWPIHGKIKETWHVLEQLYEEGLVNAIGVSNFLPHHLEELSVHANIAPAVDQFECNPYLTRKELRNYCKKHNIVPEAWSPLARGACFDDPVLQSLAEKYEKNIAQIILRYDVQNGIVTIPKSTKEARILSNSQVFDFELSTEDIEKIDTLNKNEMHGDPDHVDF